MKQIPKTGLTAPDFKVLTASGEPFQLKEALKTQLNLVLIFYRGHW